MMEIILKTINSDRSANYHLNKFLSASVVGSSFYSVNFCRKDRLMSSPLMWCAYDVQGKKIPINLDKTPTSTCTFPFQNLLPLCSVAIVLDLSKLFGFLTLKFSVDFINKCLDFSSLENCLTFHAYQIMCCLLQNHSTWY